MAEHGRQSSTRVQQGGFWNSPGASYSPSTQNLLKEMMQESKLNNFQQRQLTARLRSGEALPTTCHPTTSAKPRAPSQKLPPPKSLNPRNYSGGVRSKEVIEATGGYERPDYKPRPVVVRSDKDKERLSNIMAYGKDITPPSKAALQASREMMWKQRQEQLEKPDVDRFDELQSEIEDRQKFLDEMIALGQEAKYRPIISTEISQKLREMEVIDKERTAELERMIAENESS